MSDAGRKIRWSRFLNPTYHYALVVPIDHGLTMGPIEGISRMNDFRKWIDSRAITGIIAHKGLLERLAAVNCLSHLGVMVHLNGAISIDDAPDKKEMLTTVASALSLGADAVSVQVNFKRGIAAHNLKLLGSVVDEAHAYGLPVLTMVYDKTVDAADPRYVERMRHLMRATVELGVDAIKVSAPPVINRIPELIDGIQEHTPVLFAGGSVTPDQEVLALTRAIASYGAAGICMGRNVFQRRDPASFLMDVSETMKRNSKMRLAS